MKKKLLSSIIAMTLALLMVACGSDNVTSTGNTIDSLADTTEAMTPTLRIALPTWVGYGSLYVAQEKGFFEECGVNVELSIVEGLAERKQALISGELDGLATAVDVFVNLEGAGVPMDMVWLFDRSNGADGLVTTSDVTNPADLKGKTVAVEEGTTAHLFLLKILEQSGLTAEDIELMPMTSGAAGTAFVAGQVDAAVTYDPYLEQGLEAGGNGFTTAEYDIDLMDAVGFTDEVIESNPDAVQEFVDALSMATDYMNENRNECVSIIADGLQLEEDDVSNTLEKMECYDLSGNLFQMGETEGQEGRLYETVNDISEFYVKQGINDTEITTADIINTSFARSVKK